MFKSKSLQIIIKNDDFMEVFSKEFPVHIWIKVNIIPLIHRVASTSFCSISSFADYLRPLTYYDAAFVPFSKYMQFA